MDYQDYLLMIRRFLIDPRYVCKETYEAIGPTQELTSSFDQPLKNMVQGTTPTSFSNPATPSQIIHDYTKRAPEVNAFFQAKNN